MSLPPFLWEALQLDPSVVRERARYFASYTQVVDQPQYDVRNLIRLLQDGPLSAGPNTVVNMLDPTDEAALILRQRLEETIPSQVQESWVSIGETADAWRQAAIANLMSDTQAGRRALLRASQDYRRLGLPFGLFLDVTGSGSGEAAVEAYRQLGLLLRRESAVPGPVGIQGTALDAPTQQAALLLSALSAPPAMEEAESLLTAIASSAQATGSAPVGTTAQPIALWWAAGQHLVELILGDHSARHQLRLLISDLALAHGRQLSFAQLDCYHWPIARARVDLVDLDLAGIVAITDRALRRLRAPSWDLADDFGPLPSLAKISLTVGIQLSPPDGPPSAEWLDPEPSAPDPQPSVRAQRSVRDRMVKE